MPADAKLLNDNQILVISYTDPLMMSEVTSQLDEYYRAVLDKSPTPIHFVVDFTHITNLPSNVLTTGLNIARHFHPMIGMIVLVTNNPYISAIVNTAVATIGKIVPSRKIIIVRNMDEALMELEPFLSKENHFEAIAHP